MKTQRYTSRLNKPAFDDRAERTIASHYDSIHLLCKTGANMALMTELATKSQEQTFVSVQHEPNLTMSLTTRAFAFSCELLPSFGSRSTVLRRSRLWKG